MGIDRVLLGLDYPYEDPKECMDFLENLPIPEEEKERIYGGNAGYRPGWVCRPDRGRK